MAAVLDTFFRPATMGNGRKLITGRIEGTQGDSHDVRWTVAPKNTLWPRADFDPSTPHLTGKVDGDTFWFYAYGFHPSPYELTLLTYPWAADSGVFSVSNVESAPHAVSRSFYRLKSVGSLATCQATADTYFYDSVADKIYANSPGGSAGLVYSMGDSAFVEGNTYTLYVDWRSTLTPSWTQILAQEFTWYPPVIDLRNLWDQNLVPDWISGSKGLRAMRHAVARRMEDIYSWFEDIYHQSDTSRATWALPIWEQLLNIPNGAVLSTPARQQFLTARRLAGTGSKTDFFNGLEAVVGDVSISEDYDDLTILMTMLGSVNADLRKLGEAYIAQAKTAGIQATLAYSGGFIVGVSAAGDPI